jgi:hypothetical protein
MEIKNLAYVTRERKRQARAIRRVMGNRRRRLPPCSGGGGGSPSLPVFVPPDIMKKLWPLPAIKYTRRHARARARA